MKKVSLIAITVVAMFPLAGGIQAGDYSYQSSKQVVDPPLEVEDDSWEFLFTGYGVLPWVDMRLSGGTEINLDPGNIWDALNMTAQFEVELRKGKWGVSADVIYVDINFNPDIDAIRNIRFKEWIIMPRLNYRAWEGTWGFLDLQAGLRSTSVQMTVEGDIPSIRAGSILPGGPGLKGDSFSKSGYAAIWDASFGVRGQYNLSDRFFLDYYGELGAGDSDLIAQAFAAVGYRLNNNADMFFGFRYVYWDFATGVPLEDETAYGPE
ncbi:MAG: hypothetical protein ACR2RV_16000, partial [Verrucomicrobiales bacterium]